MTKTLPELIAMAEGARFPLELASALRELIADAECLDWMQEKEMTPWRMFRTEWHLKTDGSNSRERRDVFEGWSVDGYDEPHPTIRAAIAAARKG